LLALLGHNVLVRRKYVPPINYSQAVEENFLCYGKFEMNAGLFNSYTYRVDPAFYTANIAAEQAPLSPLGEFL
jgi:hypothetical protein